MNEINSGLDKLHMRWEIFQLRSRGEAVWNSFEEHMYME